MVRTQLITISAVLRDDARTQVSLVRFEMHFRFAVAGLDFRLFPAASAGVSYFCEILAARDDDAPRRVVRRS